MSIGIELMTIHGRRVPGTTSEGDQPHMVVSIKDGMLCLWIRDTKEGPGASIALTPDQYDELRACGRSE